MDISRFKKLPFMGILRGIDIDSIEPLVGAIIASGLETIEIAMNTIGADRLIEKAVRVSGGRLMIGAGTVLNIDILRTAIDSGATFIVTPIVIEDVMSYCEKNVVPVFPGALTPSEIYKAWSHGATMVKVFPSGVFGPEYFREIKAPLNNIELMACGGVRHDNICSYFGFGADAVAFGSGLFRPDWIASGDFNNIERSLREIIAYSPFGNKASYKK